MNLSPLPCPVCALTSIRQTLDIVDHEYNLDVKARYSQCGECASFSQRPMPGLQTLAGYYPPDYHSFDGNTFITRLKHKQRLKGIKPLLKTGSFTFLDYGCGAGAFLDYVCAQYPNAGLIGYEIAQNKEIVFHNNNRVKLIRGSFQDLLDELPLVDFISMHHVIEHLPDPFATIQALYAKLNPSGFFLGQTPACNSFEYGVFKKNWSGFHAPRHTVIFSTAGMKKFLERNGFSSVKISGAFNPGGIAVSLASLPHRGQKGRIKRAGLGWLFYVGLATIFYPFDLLSFKPGIMNFRAQK